ncbi:MAG TPA: hypothetical protein VE870_00460, partial [Bacteroidales bacterium]|nr:hypothetical protein [Bacteroidales bacterium]
NQRKQYTDGGIMVEVDLVKNNDTTRVNHYSYLPVWVWKPLKKDMGNYFVLIPVTTGDEDLRQLKMQEKDREQMNQFLDDTREHLAGVPLNPFLPSIKNPGSPVETPDNN